MAEILQLILGAAEKYPTWGLFTFALIMWYLQWKRNDDRDKICDAQHDAFVEALNNVKIALEVSNTLMQALLNRRDP